MAGGLSVCPRPWPRLRLLAFAAAVWLAVAGTPVHMVYAQGWDALGDCHACRDLADELGIATGVLIDPQPRLVRQNIYDRVPIVFGAYYDFAFDSLYDKLHECGLENVQGKAGAALFVDPGPIDPEEPIRMVDVPQAQIDGGLWPYARLLKRVVAETTPGDYWLS